MLFEPQQVQKQLEDSLKALQTDYIDLYQFHSGTDEMFSTPGLWKMLEKQVQAGKVRHLGVSVSKKHASQHQVDQASEVGVETIQVVHNRLDRRPEEQMFDSCLRQDLGVLARVPLASGFLSGKYGKDATFAKSDVRNVWGDVAEHHEIVEKVATLRSEAPDGVPMAQWALAWCLQHPAVTCVIPGCKTVEQVESNARAADLEMVKDSHPQAVS
jgi:myo-inositol catabolism protein IolS